MGLFDSLMELHERLRHSRILASVPQSWPRDDSVGAEGFLPPKQAAQVMGVSLEELARLVDQGYLEAEDVGKRELWVRPALVSVMGVRQPST